jgi:hypothetical protein
MLLSRSALTFAVLCVLSGFAACGDIPSPSPAQPEARERAALSPTASAETATPVASTRILARGPGGGLRVDLRADARHVRGRVRQPDGSYKSVCVDAPEALRPAPAAAADGARGQR